MSEKDKKDKKVAEGAEESPEEAASRLKEARERFSSVVGAAEKGTRSLRKGAEVAGEKLKERAGQASTVAREKIDTAKESVRHGYGKVTKDLDQLGQDVNEYVRHNPGRSIAIAVGLGFVLGILLRPRRD